MKRYLSVLLCATMFSGVYSSERDNIAEEYFYINNEVILENNMGEDNASKSVQTTINRLDRCKSALSNYYNVLDSLWPIIETDLQEQPEMLDEFSDYKKMIQSGIETLNNKIDDAVAILSNVDSDISQLKEFRFSDVMNLFTQRVSKVLSFCNQNRERMGDNCYNKVAPVLQNLLKVSVALQTVFLFKEILGDDDTVFSCGNCCLLF